MDLIRCSAPASILISCLPQSKEELISYGSPFKETGNLLQGIQI